MNSITLAIILIVLAFAVYFVCSSNGVKLFGKKEHKVKAKKSNEEKYADVLPKEKKEHKLKIAEGVKKEKLKEDIKKDMEKGSAGAQGDKDATTAGSVGGSPKVSKITKEDFLKNNIDVPKNSNWLTTEEKKKEAEVKALPKEKEQPSTSYDFGFDADEPFGSKPSVDDDDLFAGIDIDAILAEHGMVDDDDGMPPMPPRPSGRRLKDKSIEDEFSALDDEDKYNQLASEEYFAGANQASGLGARSLEERFEDVFGKGYLSNRSGVAKEIIVGDILSSPRAKVNSAKRKERETRLKWM